MNEIEQNKEKNCRFIIIFFVGSFVGKWVSACHSTIVNDLFSFRCQKRKKKNLCEDFRCIFRQDWKMNKKH